VIAGCRVKDIPVQDHLYQSRLILLVFGFENKSTIFILKIDPEPIFCAKFQAHSILIGI